MRTGSIHASRIDDRAREDNAVKRLHRYLQRRAGQWTLTGVISGHLQCVAHSTVSELRADGVAVKCEYRKELGNYCYRLAPSKEKP